MDSPQFGCRWSLLGKLSNRDISAERFTDELRAGPMLCPHGLLDLLCHLWRERNSDGLACSHDSGVTL